MLIESDSDLYSYAVTRDFGFAPNPFHGYCTLATCKPDIRKAAKVNDWVMGIGGNNLKETRRKCIFLMKVTEKVSFQDYWDDTRFTLKKPVRNGSNVQMIGDNIYHQSIDGKWLQEDSHHSNSDGTSNDVNLNRDTGRCDQVLVSNFFFYFGNKAIAVDLDSIGYGRIRNIKKTNLATSEKGTQLITSIYQQYKNDLNYLISDPCQFVDSHKRVDQGTGKIT